MRRRESLESTSIAAFVSDDHNRIVEWNEAAERLTGCRARDVLGCRCFRVMSGRDVYGNLFCAPSCNVRRMVSRREVIRPFEIVLQPARDRRVRVRCMIIVASRGGRRFRFIHLMERTEVRPEPGEGYPAGAARDCPSPSDRSDAGPPAPPDQVSGVLTARERAILALLSTGSGTAQAALTLGISAHTVRNHVQHILRKLEVHNRIEAVLAARRARLI